MLTAKQVLLARAPATTQDARLDTLLGLADEQVSSAFGDLRNRAIALLTLHWIEIGKRGGVAGAVTSERVGGVGRSYQLGPRQQEDPLSTTAWGLEFIALRDSSIFAPSTYASLGGQAIPDPLPEDEVL